MTKLLANVFLLIFGLFVMFGNYWWTFGLWPKSWLSFIGFGVAAILLFILRTAIEKEK